MKRHLIVTMVVLVVSGLVTHAQEFAQVKTLSASIVERMKTSGRKTVAVVDFTDLQGTVTELGRFLAEEFSVGLAGGSGGIETIDRTHLRAILAEHKLSSSGLIDPQTARRLGQITGVDTLLTGTLTPFGDSVRLSLKLLDANTARVVAASSADFPRTKAIEELLGRSITSSPASPAAARPAAAAAPAGGQKLGAHGVSFTLEICRRSSGGVVCQLRLVNEGDDRNVSLSVNDSRCFDHNGNEYRASAGSIANAADNGSVWKMLVSGVLTGATVSFADVDSRATILSVVEVRGWAYAPEGSRRGGRVGSDGEYILKFRNVPIQ